MFTCYFASGGNLGYKFTIGVTCCCDCKCIGCGFFLFDIEHFVASTAFVVSVFTCYFASRFYFRNKFAVGVTCCCDGALFLIAASTFSFFRTCNFASGSGYGFPFPVSVSVRSFRIGYGVGFLEIFSVDGCRDRNRVGACRSFVNLGGIHVETGNVFGCSVFINCGYF